MIHLVWLSGLGVVLQTKTLLVGFQQLELVFQQLVIFISLKKIILTQGHVFLAFRERRRKRGKHPCETEASMRDRSIHWLPPVCAGTTGDRMCLDWESNLQPFSYETML